MEQRTNKSNPQKAHKGTIENSCSHISHQESLGLLFLRKWRSVSDFGIESQFGWIYILQGETRLLSKKQTNKTEPNQKNQRTQTRKYHKGETSNGNKET